MQWSTVIRFAGLYSYSYSRCCHSELPREWAPTLACVSSGTGGSPVEKERLQGTGDRFTLFTSKTEAATGAAKSRDRRDFGSDSRAMIRFWPLGGSSSAVERQLPKLDVAGSIPVSRSMFPQNLFFNLFGRSGTIGKSRDDRGSGQPTGGLAYRVRQPQPTRDCPQVKNGNTSAGAKALPRPVLADRLVGQPDEAAGNDRGKDRNLQRVDDSLLVSTGQCVRINY